MERDDAPAAAGSAGVRIDRWLLAARVFRTRTDCAAACEAGKVTVNGQPAKAHRLVREGDRVGARTRAGERLLVIRALGIRRLSPEDARELYEDHSPPLPPREAPRTIEAARVPGSGRPTKRDRRLMDRFRSP